jgi:CRISPR-associated protein Csb2
VPTRGRLEQLDWCFANGLYPPPGVFEAYTPVARRDRELAARAVFGDPVVFRLAGPVRVQAETTLKVTNALRAAVLSLAGAGDGPVSGLLSGHGEHPHAAYVALPFVSEEQEHADGHVLGLAVILPRTVDAATRRHVLRPLGALRRLDVAGAGRLALERVTAASVSPAGLRPAVWAGPASIWTTVTPVLLDRFPKKGYPAERIIADGCHFVGLPEPCAIRVGRFSPLHGVGPCTGFLTVRRLGDPPRLSRHVTLAFDNPVRGPVLLGAGRYFGLGLLRPLRGCVPPEEDH